MPKIGYARVSSSSQDLDIQKAKLIAAGCEVIRLETASGASRDDRSELATVMEFLRDGDELVVHRLDRIGRSIRDVLNLVHELDARGASLRVLEPAVTTASDMGPIVITVLGMVADMELKFIHDRQRAGIEAAKGKGVYKGPNYAKVPKRPYDFRYPIETASVSSIWRPPIFGDDFGLLFGDLKSQNVVP